MDEDELWQREEKCDWLSNHIVSHEETEDFALPFGWIMKDNEDAFQL